MPTSSFYLGDCATLDYVQPTRNNHGLAYVGDLQIGGSKAALYRTLLDFNVTVAPYQGRPLTAADTIIAAQLDAYANTVGGAGGFACRVERNARDDWRDDQATWNEYKTGSAWTAGGGDVDAVPAALAFNSPAALGAFSITGLAAYVVDALTYHGGIVQLRFRADDEAANHYFSLVAAAADSRRARLVVAYTSDEVAETPIASPARSPLPGPRPVSPTRPARPVRPVRGARP